MNEKRIKNEELNIDNIQKWSIHTGKECVWRHGNYELLKIIKTKKIIGLNKHNSDNEPVTKTQIAIIQRCGFCGEVKIKWS